MIIIVIVLRIKSNEINLNIRKKTLKIEVISIQNTFRVQNTCAQNACVQVACVQIARVQVACVQYDHRNQTNLAAETRRNRPKHLQGAAKNGAVPIQLEHCTHCVLNKGFPFTGISHPSALARLKGIRFSASGKSELRK